MPSEKRLKIRAMAMELRRIRANPEILEEWKRRKSQPASPESLNKLKEKFSK